MYIPYIAGKKLTAYKDQGLDGLCTVFSTVLYVFCLDRRCAKVEKVRICKKHNTHVLMLDYGDAERVQIDVSAEERVTFSEPDILAFV